MIQMSFTRFISQELHWSQWNAFLLILSLKLIQRDNKKMVEDWTRFYYIGIHNEDTGFLVIIICFFRDRSVESGTISDQMDASANQLSRILITINSVISTVYIIFLVLAVAILLLIKWGFLVYYPEIIVALSRIKIIRDFLMLHT